MTVPVRLLQPLIPGLVLYLPFWEGVGTFAEDVSPYRNNGTLLPAISPPTWVNGVIGKALQFDGATNYVSCANSTSLNLASSFSVCMWVKMLSWSPITFDRILSKVLFTTYQGNYYVQNYLTGGVHKWQVGFFGTLNEWIPSLSTITLNIWYHVISTFNNTTKLLCLYVNGILDNSAIRNDTPIPNTYPLYIGAWNSNYANFITDEVRIFNRDLIASEAWEEYYRGARMNY